MKKLFVLGIILCCASFAAAYPNFAVKEKLSCGVCHVNIAGGAELTDNGKVYLEKSAFEVKPAELDKSKIAEYIGVAKCKMCHMPVHKSWAETPHAKAFETLAKADEKTTKERADLLKVTLGGKAEEAPECLICHTTGYGLTGGYIAKDAKLENVKNVTCEACHGPGSIHMKAKKEEKKAAINTNPTEKMCIACHNKDQSPKFNFDEYRKKGVHAKAK